MLATEKRTFTNLFKEDKFQETLGKLSRGDSLDFTEKSYLLAASILLLRKFQQDHRFTTYADLSYYIVLKYGILYEDYRPLYDFSMSFGFYPIANKIIQNELYSKNIIRQALEHLRIDDFRNSNGDVLTLEQFVSSAEFLNDDSKESCYLAPTSFGKSTIIIEKIRQLGESENRIGIIVPTKSLLVQTLQMVRASHLNRKILIHDEMFDGESSFIAVFTQERALRLLLKNETSFDTIFIDEAHNLFDHNSRSILLSRLLITNSRLNPDNRVFYLSPLVQDPENLRYSEYQNISSHIVRFNVKEPDIFELRLNGELHQYNRFANKFYKLKENVNWSDYVITNSGEKNFLYNRRPIKIEKLANELASYIPRLETPAIIEIINILQREVHSDFYVIDTLQHGIIYLHGKLPDLLKEYLEFKFKIIPEIKYVIANTVILEGMNLPIDTLYIFNTRALNGKELINLIGRVNRLNVIFQPEYRSLKKLVPQIHFINSEEHNQRNSNMSNKITILRSRVFDDSIHNPTLESFDITKEARTEEQRQNIIKIQTNETFLTTTQSNENDRMRAYLIQSGINEFYSDLSEVIPRLTSLFTSISGDLSEQWSSFNMLDKIEYAFLRGVDSITDFEVRRLRSLEAREYYENHILIAQKQSLNENILSQVSYFENRAQTDDRQLYIGHSYGEITRASDNYQDTQQAVYVDLSGKSRKELVNLALVKLKMEDDFISFKINKFIVMLYDYDAITTDEYNLYIYGTTDTRKIKLTKYGLSVSMVSKLELAGQLENLGFDENNNLTANEEFMDYLSTLDDFYQFELRRYIN